MFTTPWAAGFSSQSIRRRLRLSFAGETYLFEAQKLLRIEYKGTHLKKEYVADFVCFRQIIMEIKACEGLTGRDEGQIINYMKATHMRVGLLLNFGRPNWNGSVT